MRPTALLAVTVSIALCLWACDAVGPTQPDHLAQTAAAVQATGVTSYEICHVTGEAGTTSLNVPGEALEAHIAHGDWLVEVEKAGDGIDNDCDGKVDEVTSCSGCADDGCSMCGPRCNRCMKGGHCNHERCSMCRSGMHDMGGM